MSRSFRSGRLATGIGLALAASMAVAPTGLAQADPTEEPTPLKVGLGFIPSVQFAQFYLADQAGFYEEAGVAVTFENKIDPELITLLGQGAVDVGMADGTSLIPAVSQGIPVRYGTTVYGDFPNVVFALADSGIETVADLEGQRIGIPGRFGSSWVMLQALLASEGLTVDDVEVVTYPDFGQRVAVEQGQVDAATGFINNEPVQLAQAGLAVNVLRVDEVAPLPGPGLATGVDTLAQKPEALQAFATATVRAMEAIAADPQLGLEATFQRVPELASDPETQLAVLEATIEAWLSDHALEQGIGAIDRSVWQSGLDIMSSLPDSVVAESLTVDDLVTDELQP